MKSPLIRLTNVSKIYYSKQSETKALGGIDISVDRGDFVSIIGPSGCGKTTIFSLLANIETPTSGNIHIDKDSTIGYMFQSDTLFEWRTVYENAILALELNNKLTKHGIDYVNSLIDSFGLRDFASSYPRQLSGGMKQRVALIRTLALEPDIILLDEPFSALDYQTRLRLSDEIWHSLKAMNKTVILVTHNIREAISFSDNVIVLSKRPAKVVRNISIDFEKKDRNLIFIEKEKEFSSYFETIWQVIDDGK